MLRRTLLEARKIGMADRQEFPLACIQIQQHLMQNVLFSADIVIENTSQSHVLVELQEFLKFEHILL